LLTKYNYWLFKNVISSKDRAKIKKFAKEGGYSSSLIQRGEEQNIVPDKSHRDSKVFFSNDDYYYQLFVPFVAFANESAGWKFNIDWYETVQVSKYTKNEHYDWHQDGPSDHAGIYDSGRENYEGKVRKLSLITILSNGCDGGKFQMANDDPTADNRVEPDMDIGDVIVFPSYLWHRISPVTKGTKHSLAMWCLGPPFV